MTAPVQPTLDGPVAVPTSPMPGGMPGGTGQPVKITSLDAAQIAALETTRERWLAHGLATGPANRQEAEAGVRDAYRAAGLTPPEVMIWFGSPMAGAIAAWMLTTTQAQVGAQVWDQVRDQVGAQVWDQVGAQVWDQVRAQVGAQVRAQVRAQVGAQVWDQVRAQVRDQVGQAVPGQHDAGWLAFYDYFRTHCTIQAADRLAGMMRVAQNSGWWWPLTNAAILTERPTVLHRDGQGRLHHETGPALTYPDTFSIWAWHGTRVPQDLIETNWSLRDIFDEPNAEIRRCAIEKTGWDTFIRESGLRKVASAPDPGNAPYHLALYDLPEELDDLYEEPARILLAVNGSPEPDGEHRRFGLPVPAHHTNPIEAAAEMYGMPVAAYQQLEVRR